MDNDVDTVRTQERLAVTALRLAAVLIDAGQDERAEQMMFSPGANDPRIRPMFGRMTEVALKHLDKWHSAALHDVALGSTQIPYGDRIACEVATNVLLLSRRGIAFDAMEDLERDYGDDVVLRAATRAVTGSLRAWAIFENCTVRSVGMCALTTRSFDVPPRSDYDTAARV